MKSYQEYVETLVALTGEAAALAPPEPRCVTGAAAGDDAPKVLLCSPHPDDECITGVLPYRLSTEGPMRVVNLGITLGSDKTQRARRRKELQNACTYLAWDLLIPGAEGFDKITRAARRGAPDAWRAKVEVTAAHIAEQAPRVLCFPHERDWNGTHEGVNALVWDALALLGDSLDTYLVETEFWHAMDAPNLMAEADVECLGHLCAATALHVGEVARNPYHLLLPAWMQDNVRRGGERVGGQGNAAPDFRFATLYRLRRWEGGEVREVLDGGRIVPASESLAELFA